MPNTEQKYPYPQYPHAEPFAKLLFETGFLTFNNGKYPLATRGERAKTYREYIQGSLSKGEAVREGKEIEEINRQFTEEQKEMLVSLDGMGEMSARYVVLNLDKKREPKSLIFLIPGISNDLEGSGMLGHKLAQEGHHVVILSYPESWHGKTTEEFGAAVESDQEFGPHTAFFQQMIENITVEEKLDPANTENGLELWGHSTGSVIAANLLKKEEKYRNSVKRAVLCNPAACVDSNPTRLNFGLLVDTIKNLFAPQHLPGLNPSIPTTVNKTDHEREMMLKTHFALRDSVLKKYPWWKDISLENDKIFVVSATGDLVVHSKHVLDEIRQVNPRINIKEIPGPHTIAITNPEAIFAAID